MAWEQGYTIQAATTQKQYSTPNMAVTNTTVTSNSIQEGVRGLTGFTSHALMVCHHSKLVVCGEQHVSIDNLSAVQQVGGIPIWLSIFATLKYELYWCWDVFKRVAPRDLNSTYVDELKFYTAGRWNTLS